MSRAAGLVSCAVASSSDEVLRNRMREFFTYGSVGRVGGNPGSYPEPVSQVSRPLLGQGPRHLPAGDGGNVMLTEKIMKKKLKIPEEYKVITLIIVGKHADGLSPILSEKQAAWEKQRPERKPFEEFAYLNQFKEG